MRENASFLMFIQKAEVIRYVGIPTTQPRVSTGMG